MKRLFGLTLAVAALFPAICPGQGTLVFTSGNTALVRDAFHADQPFGAYQAQVQFAWAPLGTPFVRWDWLGGMTEKQWIDANPGWTVIGSPADVGVLVPGRFYGGTLTAETATPGAVIQGIVIGWTGTGAHDFLEGYWMVMGSGALNAIGTTAPFTVDTGNPIQFPPGTPGNIYNSTSTPYTGLYLGIPEPSGISLLLLAGAVAFVRYRRR